MHTNADNLWRRPCQAENCICFSRLGEEENEEEICEVLNLEQAHQGNFLDRCIVTQARATYQEPVKYINVTNRKKSDEIKTCVVLISLVNRSLHYSKDFETILNVTVPFEKGIGF